jgi:rubrerythrin
MIAKERLLAGLFELEYVEEGIITLYVNFAKGLVQNTEGMEDAKKKEIEKLLTRLYRDSMRHKEIVDGLIKQVETGTKNEY